MKISFSTIPGNLRKDTGYGYAGFNMIKSLQQLGHEVPYCDRSAPVQICFSQPQDYVFYEGQYKIGYTPWESTVLHPGWAEQMNELDELWTPTEQCKTWFEGAGITVPIYIYPHGINHIFEPRRRVVGNKLKFLHIGEPAVRKAGQLAVDAFRKVFANSDEVSLTLKCFGENTTRAFVGNEIIGSSELYNNVQLDMSVPSTEDLVNIYYNHHVLVYPSWGEGFGLIPLEAVATGMPAVVTEAWAPYKKFILPVKSSYTDSPWPMVHPGQMYEPDFDDLCEWYAEIYRNPEIYLERAYAQAPQVHEEFDWVRVTEKSFKHIFEKFSAA